MSVVKVIYVHCRIAASRDRACFVDVTPEVMDRHDTRANVRREARLDLDNEMSSRREILLQDLYDLDLVQRGGTRDVPDGSLILLHIRHHLRV